MCTALSRVYYRCVVDWFDLNLINSGFYWASAGLQPVWAEMYGKRTPNPTATLCPHFVKSAQVQRWSHDRPQRRSPRQVVHVLPSMSRTRAIRDVHGPAGALGVLSASHVRRKGGRCDATVWMFTSFTQRQHLRPFLSLGEGR